MAIKTKIEWCDSTVNAMMGCDGCELWNRKVKTCYAGVMTGSCAGRKGWPESFDKPEIFPGRIEKACEWPSLAGMDRPDKPWLNGYPRLIFLNDMGDTFTESLPVDWLMPYVDMMQRSPHIWLILSKRISRMKSFFELVGYVPDNFWIGTTATDQRTFIKRALRLMTIEKAPVYFYSLEPLLGRIHLCFPDRPNPDGDVWVIAGFESGKVARIPTESTYIARDIRDQCNVAGVPFFFKQWGGTDKHRSGRMLDGHEWSEIPKGIVGQAPASPANAGGAGKRGQARQVPLEGFTI